MEVNATQNAPVMSKRNGRGAEGNKEGVDHGSYRRSVEVVVEKDNKRGKV